MTTTTDEILKYRMKDAAKLTTQRAMLNLLFVPKGENPIGRDIRTVIKERRSKPQLSLDESEKQEVITKIRASYELSVEEFDYLTRALGRHAHNFHGGSGTPPASEGQVVGYVSEDHDLVDLLRECGVEIPSFVNQASRLMFAIRAGDLAGARTFDLSIGRVLDTDLDEFGFGEYTPAL